MNLGCKCRCGPLGLQILKSHIPLSIQHHNFREVIFFSFFFLKTGLCGGMNLFLVTLTIRGRFFGVPAWGGVFPIRPLCWVGQDSALGLFSSFLGPGDCNNENLGLPGSVNDPASLSFFLHLVFGLSILDFFISSFIHLIHLNTFYLLFSVVCNFQVDPGTYCMLLESEITTT